MRNPRVLCIYMATRPRGFALVLVPVYFIKHSVSCYNYVYNYISDIYISNFNQAALRVDSLKCMYVYGPVDACIISFTARSTSLLELWWTVFGKVGPILAIKNQSGGGPLLYCQNWSWLHAAEKLSSALQLFYHSCMQLLYSAELSTKYNQRLDMKLDHVSLCAQRKIVLTLLVADKMAV